MKISNFLLFVRRNARWRFQIQWTKCREHGANFVDLSLVLPIFAFCVRSFSLCTSSNLIIFRLETIPMSLLNIKLFFYRSMEGWQKRSHVETGNTPLKPAEKKSRELECSHEESPVRRSLGFQQSFSPAQKVILFMNVCNMCISQCTLSSCNLCLKDVSLIIRLPPSVWKSVMLVLFNSLKYFLSRLQASRRILKKARLVRSQRSPKQLPSVSDVFPVAKKGADRSNSVYCFIWRVKERR